MKLLTPEPPQTPVHAPPLSSARTAKGTRKSVWLFAFLILLAAVVVRVYPSAGFTGVGFDEALYRDYILKLDAVGLTNFPAICEVYIEDQIAQETITKLPPTRFLYIITSWAWKRAEYGAAAPAARQSPGFSTRDPALVSLHHVSCLFSILFVVASGLAAYRMLGPGAMLGVGALVAFTPTQIHMAQHALIDGFFAFWATMCLWMLWENLRRPHNTRWLVALGVCLTMMVLTKENSFFVFVALSALVGVNHWARFGAVTPRLLFTMFAGPLIAVLLLILLAGGVSHFVEIYRLLVGKAQNLTYAIKTGDGPWHRYLVDMMIVSPLILLLSISGLFTQAGKQRSYLYLAAFVAFTYVLMCNVRYAMNLRYATVWDLPLCALAFGQIQDLGSLAGKHRDLVAALITIAVCAYGLRQYLIFFSDYGLYELVTEGLLRAVKILK